MTDTDTNPEPRPERPPEDHRYGGLTLADDNCLVYDREHPDAWIQSDHCVEVAANA